MIGTIGKWTDVTIDEYQWLQDERRKAIRDLGGQGLNTLFPKPGELPPCRVYLRVRRRDRSGQLTARLETNAQNGGQRYVRNLRVPLGEPSTRGRGIRLRVVGE